MKGTAIVSQGSFVKRARVTLDLTQAELADKLGLERRSILRYERGDELPKHVRFAIKHLLTERRKKIKILKRYIVECKKCGLSAKVEAHGTHLPIDGCCDVHDKKKLPMKVHNRTGERAMEDETASA